jgi:1-phosphofructokinase
MIVTVTPNTGIDRTICIPHFEWDSTIRANQMAVGIGGKAIDTSWVLGEMNVENTALGFAAGITGKQMENMLSAKGVKTDFIWVSGESRTNTIIINQGNNSQSTITTNSLIVTTEQTRALLDTYQATIKNADCVVIGGSLPANISIDLYTKLIELANEANKPIIFDASGEALKIGIQAKPTLIKPNKDELQEFIKKELTTMEEVIEAANQINKQYGCTVVVTLGEEGAIAVDGEKQYFIEPIKVNIQSTAGTGDAIVAGLAKAYAENKPLTEGLRTGFAAAVAVMLTLGTADCHLSDIHYYYDKIKIKEINL